jgi:Fusaric acid resistance protein family
LSIGAAAGVSSRWLPVARPFSWERATSLIARELAPSPRKIRTAFRITTIGTIGAALITICHVNNELGTYIIWLLVGAGPMLSLRKASAFLVAEGLALAVAVVTARALAETPWLTLPFVFALVSFSTYLGNVVKLGAALLLIEVVCLDLFYGVVFAPREIGWAASGAFGGTAIAFGVLVVFDNWIWPQRGEPMLMESLAVSVARIRVRLIRAGNFYLELPGSAMPPLPPPTSDLPAHSALLAQAVAEGISAHRHAVLLAAVTRVARINIEVDRLIIAAREIVPHEIRRLVHGEIQAVVDAIAAVLEELGAELPTRISVGVDTPPSLSRMQARAAIDALEVRIIEVRPFYISHAGSAEIENFASFTDALSAMVSYLERLLDEPPNLSTVAAGRAGNQPPHSLDPTLVRYSLKVGLCVVIGLVIGVVSNRPELSTIITTVLITALPTYGAALRKMILRIVGAIIGGAVSLLAIVIVTPNFATLPAYLLALFIVFWISAYSSLSSGRVSYAGKQIGTTYALVFAGLSPSLDIYAPLWRIWGILLGTVVVAVIALIVWPEYAGDSLLPRLQQVLRDVLALVPGAFASTSEQEIVEANSDTMRVLAEILEIADDAQLEGRAGLVNPDAIVQAAGTLRRIANRFASIASGRIVVPVPQLDAETEAAREAALDGIRGQLELWLDFFSGGENLSDDAARAVARSLSVDNIVEAVERFGARLGENGFARIEGWMLDQRRTILSELQSMRRLGVLMVELNRWLAHIPGDATQIE